MRFDIVIDRVSPSSQQISLQNVQNETEARSTL